MRKFALNVFCLANNTELLLTLAVVQLFIKKQKPVSLHVAWNATVFSRMTGKTLAGVTQKLFFCWVLACSYPVEAAWLECQISRFIVSWSSIAPFLDQFSYKGKLFNLSWGASEHCRELWDTLGGADSSCWVLGPCMPSRAAFMYHSSTGGYM